MQIVGGQESGTSNQKESASLDVLGFVGSGEGLIPTQDNLTKLEVGKAYYQLGKLHYDKADLNKAEVNFLKAIDCAECPQDNYRVLKILSFLIRIAAEKLEDEKAEKYISHSEAIVNDLQENLGSLSAEYFYYSGLIKSYRTDFDGAYQDLDLSYNKSKEENDPDLHSKCLLALANNAFNRGQFELSLEYMGQLDNLLKIINKEYLGGSMHMTYGKIHMATGNIEASLKHFNLANITLQNKKCWNLYGYILLGIGQVQKVKGDYDRATLYYNLAKQAVDSTTFKRLTNVLDAEIHEVNDSSVDIYLDRNNRKVKEKNIGVIDFKHRFVLLEILFLLAKNRGSFFDKEDLAREIWKDEYNPLIHDKLIYTSISRLRKLIEPKDNSNTKRKYIIRGKDGYTFNPDVKIRYQMETKLTAGKAVANVDISSPV
ncbi:MULTISPECIES: helix-turn-helix domain-containing protein [Halobacteriovorax]|uniref:Helix-turn-helix domain-containing protein n=1 Tax=Halobacteriovorax vibrionivorans TaxID=2152716 RepID=A0ABY0IFX4_9BACT|nr:MULTISPECIES: helix-turn-helix domain-containing protein [Halobacteriovorax]AYF44313.1 transcriptional regulatory protein, C-terminal domain protein [Halobacteriovorax sp. BALOs_7]RZF20439.1 helix-turn-helix domain-containing protein [Halobacteriovorax vibrionivorans]TGD46612.1 helix-turn-helix domain-containing protein [Halobacteriovorax sp. Y22]